MMSLKFRNFVLLVMLFSFVGLPIILGLKQRINANSSVVLKNSNVIDIRMEKMVANLKATIPTPYDEYLTLIDIEKINRDIVYSFEVKAKVEKLMTMEDYFQRQNQFDVCNLSQKGRNDYETGNIRVVARYKSYESDKFYFEIKSMVSDCNFNPKAANLVSPDILNTIEEDLLNEYYNFFMLADDD